MASFLILACTSAQRCIYEKWKDRAFCRRIRSGTCEFHRELVARSCKKFTRFSLVFSIYLSLILFVERNVIVDDRHPCSFKSLKSQSPATAQPTLPAPESSEDSSADEHFPPDRLAKRSLDEPVSDLHKTLDRLSGTNDLQQSAGDLKGEITKFLEDLIEKHPETLDAIESVRMNRMGRISEKNALPSTDPIPQLSRAILRNNNLTTPNSTTHVAYNHEDTTPGAVHSFQDEQGNWWTYAFDQESSGVAHALGSSRAISAIFNKRRRQSDDGTRNTNFNYYTNIVNAFYRRQS